MPIAKFSQLRKQLALLDIFVISAGAMISSGFFLLPGLAATETGSSVVLAYLLAGLLIVPAMLSQAELSTAMPKAGGAYYYLDRTLGPLVGTIGGLGTWIALVLKSAFALIGMGAYLSLVVDLPLVSTAIVFAVLFTALNIFGAKQTSGLLRVFVLALLVMLSYFLLHGLAEVSVPGEGVRLAKQFTPFLTNGVDGLLGAVGLVFVSFVGLTKVASLAEEIKNPDRNIPLGMLTALVTVVVIYVLGVFLMVSVLGVDALSHSLTPVADTASAFTRWIPSRVSMWLMVGAAVLAFASMANAGILAASRYPLAMARDKIFPEIFAVTYRKAPVPSILLTGVLLILMLLTLDVMSVAKLASALQLLLFGLINFAVVVMRESGLDSYDPGFRSPFYPWPQLVGIFFPLVLVAEMGWLPVLFTLGVTAVAFGWFNSYARRRVVRDGAIFHVFERLGRRRFAGLDRELRNIMKEKGLRADDAFDHLVENAEVIDQRGVCALDAIIHDASVLLSRRVPASREELEQSLTMGITMGVAPVAHGAALLHARLPVLEESALVVVRCEGGVSGTDPVGEERGHAEARPVHAVFVLVSGKNNPGRHLRILAQLAGRVEDETFIGQWLEDQDERELKATLLGRPDPLDV